MSRRDPVQCAKCRAANAKRKRPRPLGCAQCFTFADEPGQWDHYNAEIDRDRARENAKRAAAGLPPWDFDRGCIAAQVHP